MAERSLDDLGPPERPVKPYYLKSIFGGMLSGWVLVFIPYLAVLFIKGLKGFDAANGLPEWTYVYNGSLLLLMPLVQGFVAALLRGRLKQGIGSGFVIITAVAVLDIAIATIFLHEGVICVIMASPLLLLIIGLGYAVGRGIAGFRRSRMVSMSLAPLAVLGVIGETAGPAPDYPAVVVDAVTVDAPPEYVWRYIVDYPDNPNPPDYWLWRAGLPAPTHSVAPVQAVGARRDCKFTGDQAFEEKIVVLEPNRRLVFDITRQPDHPEIIGHISVDRGEMVLTRNPDGTTTVTATSWYRLHVRPAPYFAWWAQDVTRHIHFRVMGHMKTLAERDYGADTKSAGKGK